MENNQKILNWLNKEKVKDDLELKKSKTDFIEEIKSFSKEDFFTEKNRKKTLWQKIRKMIWGF